MAQKIQVRRDTAANWSTSNPTLAAGEPGLETDTGKTKYGNGSTAWNSLGYTVGGGESTIAPTGVAATDTAAIQAAHDALPSLGGEIRLTGGVYSLLASGLSFTKPVKLRGVGKSAGAVSVPANYPADTAITRIEYSSTTGTAITVSSNACLFQDFHLINTSVTAPTAGAGIAVTTGGGAGFEYRSISVAGFYRNIDHGNGFEWTMDACTIFDFVQAGIRIANPALPDGGDMGITNCQIMAGPNRATAVAGIEWVSSGGLRVANCKFNRRGAGTLSVGIYLHPADGIQTSVFQIDDNSFENMGYGIYSDDAGNTGTGLIGKINIKDNEFYCLTKALALLRTTTGKTNLVQIKDNIVTSTGANNATAGIQISNMDTVQIGGNMYATNITTAGRLTIGSGVTNLTHTDIRVDSNAGAPTNGTVALNGTTDVVVPTTAVTAKSNIQMTQQVAGGTQSGISFVKSRVVGTSFTIASVAGDTSTVGWQIIEPLV